MCAPAHRWPTTTQNTAPPCKCLTILSLAALSRTSAWGDEHDAFKDLAKKVGEAGTSVLVASVPVAKREFEPKNVELAVSEWGCGCGWGLG